MSTAKLVTGAVCVAVAAGIGGFALHGQLASEASATVQATANSAAIDELKIEIATLNAANRRLQQENERLMTAGGAANSALAPSTPAASAGTSTLLDRLRVLAETQKAGLLSARIQLVDMHGKLSPKFAELFGLTEAEQQAMQGAYEKARQKLGEIAAANAKVRTTPDGKVVIEIPAFEGGGGVYDEAMDAFASILGDERVPAFLQLVAPQVGDELSQFGAEQRTLTIGRAADQNGEAMYSLSDQRKYPNALPSNAVVSTGSGGPVIRTAGRMTTSAQSLSRAALEQRLGPLKTLVPGNL